MENTEKPTGPTDAAIRAELKELETQFTAAEQKRERSAKPRRAPVETRPAPAMNRNAATPLGRPPVALSFSEERSGFSAAEQLLPIAEADAARRRRLGLPPVAPPEQRPQGDAAEAFINADSDVRALTREIARGGDSRPLPAQIELERQLRAAIADARQRFNAGLPAVDEPRPEPKPAPLSVAAPTRPPDFIQALSEIRRQTAKALRGWEREREAEDEGGAA